MRKSLHSTCQFFTLSTRMYVIFLQYLHNYLKLHCFSFVWFKIISNSIFCHIAHHFATMSDARLDVQHIQYIVRQTLGKFTVALINPIFPCLLQIITKFSEEFVKKFRDSLFISLNLVMHSTPKYVIYLIGH